MKNIVIYSSNKRLSEVLQVAPMSDPLSIRIIYWTSNLRCLIKTTRSCAFSLLSQLYKGSTQLCFFLMGLRSTRMATAFQYFGRLSFLLSLSLVHSASTSVNMLSILESMKTITFFPSFFAILQFFENICKNTKFVENICKNMICN